MIEKQQSTRHTIDIQKKAAAVFVSPSIKAHKTLTSMESSDGI